MKTQNIGSWLTVVAAATLAAAGCRAAPEAEAAGTSLEAAALGGAAGSAASIDRDDDVDERTDEATDNDNDVDEDSDEATGDDDYDLTFEELPAAVQSTTTAEVGDGTVTGVDRDAEQTGVVFEIDYTAADGVRYELDVAEDGTLIRSKQDD
jgi:hypothetical protein